MIKDKRIGVLMGGASREREVSLRSGAAVLRALKSSGNDAVGIDVGRDLCEVMGRERIDAAFLALHGGHGEDGSIQGFLEVLGIPYTGSGVLASALAMDKTASKVIFKSNGIPAAEFASVETLKEGVEALKEFSLPVVVKPRREGSSIGVSIVREKADFEDALTQALSFGGGALIERYIAGKEVQIGILGDSILGGVEVRPKLEFYNYKAKYTAGLTEYILPPELDAPTYARAKETAYQAHRALGCSGATRVDLIVDALGVSYVLEVNTIPGMTETSLLPKIAKTAGYGFPALLEEMLKDALKGR